MSIKLSSGDLKDKRIWLKNKRGGYEAKSGYFAALEVGYNKPQNRHLNHIDWYKDVWSLNIPPKLKLFIWKIFHEAIPVGAELKKRQVEVNQTCKRCGEEETIKHLFWDSRFAKQVWELSPITQLPNLESIDFGKAWKKLKETYCLPPIGLVSSLISAWILWRLWKDRNNIIFNSRGQSEQEIVSGSIIAAKEWSEAQAKQKQITCQPHREREETEAGTTILKSDAAWIKDKQIAGLASIFINLDRSVIRRSTVAQTISSPLVAETMALRSGLEAAIDLGILKLEVNSDCQVLINAISKRESPSKIYGVFHDITKLLPLFSKNFFQVFTQIFELGSGCRSKKCSQSIYAEQLW